jgi:hypothetical protein
MLRCRQQHPRRGRITRCCQKCSARATISIGDMTGMSNLGTQRVDRAGATISKVEMTVRSRFRKWLLESVLIRYDCHLNFRCGRGSCAQVSEPRCLSSRATKPNLDMTVMVSSKMPTMRSQDPLRLECSRDQIQR